MNGTIWGSILLLLLLILVACDIQNPLATPTSTKAAVQPTAGPTSTLFPPPGSVDGFLLFLAEVNDLKPEQRQDHVNRYMAHLSEAPLAIGDVALFLWQGAASSVELIGDMNGWDPSSAHALDRIEGSDLWYLQSRIEPEARLDYQFRMNGEESQLDPLNANQVMSETGPNSVLTMPGYVTPPELMEGDNNVPAGRLSSNTLESHFLDQTRTFFVYEPAGQIVGRQLPSLYLNDGGNYLNLIDTPALLDKLIAQRLIPPMIVVFLPPVLAFDEYRLNNAYVSFLADELVPTVQENFDTDIDPVATGVMGSGLGGLAAVYAAQERPDVFGLAAGQSVSNIFTDGGLLERGGRIKNDPDPDRPSRIYLVVGTYETAVRIDDKLQNLLEDNRRLAEGLAASGQEYLFEEKPEGHSWGLWEGTFGRALSYLYNAGS